MAALKDRGRSHFAQSIKPIWEVWVISYAVRRFRVILQSATCLYNIWRHTTHIIYTWRKFNQTSGQNTILSYLVIFFSQYRYGNQLLLWWTVMQYFYQIQNINLTTLPYRYHDANALHKGNWLKYDSLSHFLVFGHQTLGPTKCYSDIWGSHSGALEGLSRLGYKVLYTRRQNS